MISIDHTTAVPKTSFDPKESEQFATSHSSGERDVIELKHDIARLQKKQQEELTLLITEITQNVKKEFEEFFLQRYSNNNKKKATAPSYEKMLEQLNFWRKKRQAIVQERQYAETDVAKEELDVELKFIEKRIESYQQRCEKIKKKHQAQLDEIKNFREKEVKELYSNIKDFLLSREENEEEEDEEEEEEMEFMKSLK